MRLIKI